jgi:RND family efflux transporter MFP subunit
LWLVAVATLGCSPPPPSSVAAAPASTPQPTSQPAGQPAQPPQPAPQPPPPPSDFLTATGPITQEQQLDVVALRPGEIVSLDVDVDSSVQKNQALARIDDRELLDDRSAAEHKYQSLQSDLKNWQAEVQMRTVDLKRAQQMREAGINTQEEYEHTRYNLTATQYEVDRQREDALAADAAVKSLDQELAKTRIIAPFTGTISQRFVRAGQYVTAGEKLFHLVGHSPLEIRFTVPGQQVAAVRRGQSVAVSVSPDFAQPVPAVVRSVSPVIDPGSGMVEVTAVLSHPSANILPGMIASVRIPRPQ